MQKNAHKAMLIDDGNDRYQIITIITQLISVIDLYDDQLQRLICELMI
jgi:hypothetical protein